MPCDTITTITTSTLDLSKASADVLTAALVSMGLTVRLKTAGRIEAYTPNDTTIIWVQGEGTTIRSQYGEDKALAAKIPQAYSAAAMSYAAKRNGWLVKPNGLNKFQVMKR